MAHAEFPNGLGTTVTEIEKQIANDSDETKRQKAAPEPPSQARILDNRKEKP